MRVWLPLIPPVGVGWTLFRSTLWLWLRVWCWGLGPGFRTLARNSRVEKATRPLSGRMVRSSFLLGTSRVALRQPTW